MEKIAWCITGSGHNLEKAVEVLEKAVQKFEVVLFLSGAGEETLKIYGLNGRVEKLGLKIIREKGQGKSFPAIGAMYGHGYSLVVVAPATANTVAKIRFGISDSLVSGIADQAQKNRVPVIIMPCDVKGEQETVLPNGEKAKIYPSEINLENVRGLEGRKFLRTAEGIEELEKEIFG